MTKKLQPTINNLDSETSKNKSNLDRVKLWYKKVLGKDVNTLPNDLKWIVKNETKIVKYINDTYKTPTSKKSHLSTLAVVFRELGNKNKQRLYAAELQALLDVYNEKKKRQDLQGKEIENWVSHDQVLEKLDDLKQKAKDTNKVSDNLKHLALSLYVLQPPLRLDYGDVIITDQEPPKSETQNYLYRKRTGRYVLYLNRDKVSRVVDKKTKELKYGKAIIRLKKKVGSIIEKSLESFPRKYLISQSRNIENPITENGLGQLLSGLWKDKKVSADILRSSYVTWYHEKVNHNVKKIEALAELMRHTPDTARNIYRKEFTGGMGGTQLQDWNSQSQDNLLEQETQPLPEQEQPKRTKTPEIQDAKSSLEKERERARKYAKNYNKENKDKISTKKQEYYKKDATKILRQKIIRYHNKRIRAGETSSPDASKITEYNLKLDSNGLWH